MQAKYCRCWNFNQAVLPFMSWSCFCEQLHSNEDFAKVVEACMAERDKTANPGENTEKRPENAKELIRIGMRLRRSCQLLQREDMESVAGVTNPKDFQQIKMYADRFGLALSW